MDALHDVGLPAGVSPLQRPASGTTNQLGRRVAETIMRASPPSEDRRSDALNSTSAVLRLVESCVQSLAEITGQVNSDAAQRVDVRA